MILGLIEKYSAEDYDCKIKKLKSLPVLSYFIFVMYYIYGRVRAIPTYRVYRLYDNIMESFNTYIKQISLSISPSKMDFSLSVDCKLSEQNACVCGLVERIKT